MKRLWLASAMPRVTTRAGRVLRRALGSRRTPEALELARCKRVLVIRLDRTGDMVLSTPFLRELRRNLPHAHVSLLASPEAAAAVAHCPYVDEVRVYRWRRAAYLGPLPHLYALWAAARHYWDRPPDVAIVPRWDVDYYQAALVAYLSGAFSRVGYSEHISRRKSSLNRDYDLFYTHLLYDRAPKHEVERNLEFLRFLGGVVQDDRLEVWTREEDHRFAERVLQAHAIRPGEALVAVAPGAGSRRREWPVESFAHVCAWLNREHGVRPVILGGGQDVPLGQALAARLDGAAIDLVGRTSLGQSAALLGRCALFVGNDSGPMHLAAAAGVPVVGISCHTEGGSPVHENAPERFGPWGRHHVVLRPPRATAPCTDGCAATGAHCILGVTVDAVGAAVAAQLRSRHAAPPDVRSGLGASPRGGDGRTSRAVVP